jgi:hypothetical protein
VKRGYVTTKSTRRRLFSQKRHEGNLHSSSG